METRVKKPLFIDLHANDYRIVYKLITIHVVFLR